MPTPTRPPRLWLRPARGVRQAAWLILDGGKQHATGCRPDDREGAERELALYIARKHRPKGPRHPGRVPIADALRYYGTEVATGHARPEETLSRIEALLLHFGNKTCDAINGAECRAFGAKRTPAAARRALEDLRAALKHYHREGFIESVPGVSLPERSVSRERWLTRQEAARLLLAAWRMREHQGGAQTRRRPGRHIARFILIALYTGTRAGAVTGASWDQIDLVNGVFHRRPDGERLTKKRKPPVRLAPRLLAHLRRWRRIDPKARYVVEWRGEPVKRVTKGFNAAVRAAGLRGVTPHVLRHTAATWLMQAGVETWQAAGFLGMTEQVLEQVYGHHSPDFQAEAAHAITAKKSARRAK